LREGRCVQLVGVEKGNDERLTQNELKDGVSTFVVDFDVPSFLWRAHSKIWKLENRFHDELVRLERELDKQTVWYEISLEAAEAGYSYFYSTLSALPPTYFAAKTVRPVKAPRLPVKPAHSNRLLGFMEAAAPA
jgi:hypothetical protein